MCLSWKLKHPLVLPHFHLEFHHKWMLVIWVLRWWKFHLEFIYGHIYAFIVIRVILFMEYTHIVNCTTIKLDYLKSYSDLCIIIYCDFLFGFSSQSPQGTYKSNLIKFNWSANIWIWERNSHIYLDGMFLGLCVKPCATSSRCLTTLLSWRKALWYVHKTFLFENESTFL